MSVSSEAKAVDLYKGLDCGRFDPEKSDHIHGRAGAPVLLFDRMKGIKVFGCEACVFGERYQHTCDVLSMTDARIGQYREAMARSGTGSLYVQAFASGTRRRRA